MKLIMTGFKSESISMQSVQQPQIVRGLKLKGECQCREAKKLKKIIFKIGAFKLIQRILTVEPILRKTVE